MPRIRFRGLPVGQAVTLTVDQDGNTDTFTTAGWGNPDVTVLPPENTVLPTLTGTSQIGLTFGITTGTWINPVNSYEFRLKLDGAIEPGVTSFPVNVLAEWDGKTPIFGVRAVGPQATSDWVEVTGPVIRYANAPTFSVDPSFGAGSYAANATVTFALGTAGPGATVTVDTFTLNGVDKRGELSGLSWNSTGEPAGTMTLRARAQNSGGVTLSRIVTASLGVVGGAFFPASLSINAESSRVSVADLMAFGTADSLTVTAPTAGRIIKRTDGKFTIDLSEYLNVEDSIITASYTAVKSGETNITGTLTINTKKALQQMGWAPGDHYYFPVNGSDEFVIEPGESHRKVYVSPDSPLTKTYIQANHPIGNANAAFLLNTIVPVGLGGNGTWRYGEAPEVALHVGNATNSENTGATLWSELTGFLKNRTGSALYLKRGFTYNFSIAKGGDRGESPLHPHLVTAYGTGENPIITGGIGTSPGAGRNWVYQNVQFAFPSSFGQGSNIALDGIKLLPGKQTVTSGTDTDVISRALTIRRMDAKRITYEAPINGVNWQAKKERCEAIFPFAYGSLMEKIYVDIAGWMEGYLNPAVTTTYPAGTPQPPQSYSHCIYAPVGAEEQADPDALALQTNADFTFREVFASRGSLTGIQFRPGGIIYNAVMFRNNLGILFGGGNRLTALSDTDTGEHSLGYRVLVTQGGQKIGINAFSRNKGFNTNAPDTSLVRCMVAHVGPPNDGISAWGSVNETDVAYDASYQDKIFNANGEVVNDRASKNGSWRHLDIKVWDWTEAGPDENVSSFTPLQLANAAIEKFAETKWGLVSPTYEDFLDRANLEAEPWKLANEVVDFFEQQLGILPALRTTATTVRFAPQGRDKEPMPGTRWDLPDDWSTGDLPGTVATDTADLDGHKVRMFDNATIGTLTLKGGTLVKNGGRLTTSTISDGGTIELHRTGQVHMAGYAGSGVLNVTMTGGRWRNAGTIGSNFNLTATNEAEVILATGGASCTIAAGRTLELTGGRGRYGFDGQSGTATLTLAGTTRIKPLIAIGFVNRNLTNEFASYRGDFKIGETIRGEASGFTARIVDIETLPAALVAGGNAPGSVSGHCGLVYVDNLVGAPIAGESMISNLLFGLIDGAQNSKVAEVSAQAPIVTFPRIREFRSGVHGEAQPAITSVINLGGALDLHLGGVQPGTYTIAAVDTINGSFASVGGYIPPDRNAVVAKVGNTVTITVSAGTGVIS